MSRNKARGDWADGEDMVQGLGAEVEVPKLTPAVQMADLSLGVIARYLGFEERKSAQFDRPQLLHKFELGQAHGRVQFAVWGSTMMDLKLKGVQRTGIVAVVYDGRSPGGQHKWSVRPFHGTSQDLQALQERFDAGCKRVLEAVKLVEERSRGADFAGDDDLPF